MDFRPARKEDVPGVLPMVHAIGMFHQNLVPAKYTFRDDPARLYNNWLLERCEDERSVFLVADSGQQLAGFLIGTVESEIPIYQVKRFGFIHDIWVEEAFRHEGIARQLVMLAIERFSEIGVPQVRLDVAAGNPAAQHLFARCGFAASATEMLIEL